MITINSGSRYMRPAPEEARRRLPTSSAGSRSYPYEGAYPSSVHRSSEPRTFSSAEDPFRAYRYANHPHRHPLPSSASSSYATRFHKTAMYDDEEDEDELSCGYSVGSSRSVSPDVHRINSTASLSPDAPSSLRYYQSHDNPKNWSDPLSSVRTGEARSSDGMLGILGDVHGRVHSKKMPNQPFHANSMSMFLSDSDESNGMHSDRLEGTGIPGIRNISGVTNEVDENYSKLSYFSAKEDGRPYSPRFGREDTHEDAWPLVSKGFAWPSEDVQTEDGGSTLTSTPRDPSMVPGNRLGNFLASFSSGSPKASLQHIDFIDNTMDQRLQEMFLDEYSQIVKEGTPFQQSESTKTLVDTATTTATSIATVQSERLPYFGKSVTPEDAEEDQTEIEESVEEEIEAEGESEEIMVSTDSTDEHENEGDRAEEETIESHEGMENTDTENATIDPSDTDEEDKQSLGQGTDKTEDDTDNCEGEGTSDGVEIYDDSNVSETRTTSTSDATILHDFQWWGSEVETETKQPSPSTTTSMPIENNQNIAEESPSPTKIDHTRIVPIAYPLPIVLTGCGWDNSDNASLTSDSNENETVEEEENLEEEGKKQPKNASAQFARKTNNVEQTALERLKTWDAVLEEQVQWNDQQRQELQKTKSNLLRVLDGTPGNELRAMLQTNEENFKVENRVQQLRSAENKTGEDSIIVASSTNGATEIDGNHDEGGLFEKSSSLMKSLSHSSLLSPSALITSTEPSSPKNTSDYTIRNVVPALTHPHHSASCETPPRPHTPQLNKIRTTVRDTGMNTVETLDSIGAVEREIHTLQCHRDNLKMRSKQLIEQKAAAIGELSELRRQYSSQQELMKATERHIEELHSQLENLSKSKSQLAHTSVEIAKLTKEKQHIITSYQAVQEERAALEKERMELEKNHAALEKERSALEQELLELKKSSQEQLLKQKNDFQKEAAAHKLLLHGLRAHLPAVEKLRSVHQHNAHLLKMQQDITHLRNQLQDNSQMKVRAEQAEAKAADLQKQMKSTVDERQKDIEKLKAEGRSACEATALIAADLERSLYVNQKLRASLTEMEGDLRCTTEAKTLLEADLQKTLEITQKLKDELINARKQGDQLRTEVAAIKAELKETLRLRSTTSCDLTRTENRSPSPPKEIPPTQQSRPQCRDKNTQTQVVQQRTVAVGVSPVVQQRTVGVGVSSGIPLQMKTIQTNTGIQVGPPWWCHLGNPEECVETLAEQLHTKQIEETRLHHVVAELQRQNCQLIKEQKHMKTILHPDIAQKRTVGVGVSSNISLLLKAIQTNIGVQAGPDIVQQRAVGVGDSSGIPLLTNIGIQVGPDSVQQRAVGVGDSSGIPLLTNTGIQVGPDSVQQRAVGVGDSSGIPLLTNTGIQVGPDIVQQRTVGVGDSSGFPLQMKAIHTNTGIQVGPPLCCHLGNPKTSLQTLAEQLHIKQIEETRLQHVMAELQRQNCQLLKDQKHMKTIQHPDTPGGTPNLQEEMKEIPSAHVPIAVKPAPIAVKPAPIAVKRAPIAVKSAPIAVKSAPIAVKPAPIAVKPAPIAVEPAPIAVEPAPIAVEPAPIAVKLAPIAVEPAPIAVEPAPIAVEPPGFQTHTSTTKAGETSTVCAGEKKCTTTRSKPHRPRNSSDAAVRTMVDEVSELLDQYQKLKDPADEDFSYTPTNRRIVSDDEYEKTAKIDLILYGDGGTEDKGHEVDSNNLVTPASSFATPTSEKLQKIMSRVAQQSADYRLNLENLMSNQIQKITGCKTTRAFRSKSLDSNLDTNRLSSATPSITLSPEPIKERSTKQRSSNQLNNTKISGPLSANNESFSPFPSFSLPSPSSFPLPSECHSMPSPSSSWIKSFSPKRQTKHVRHYTANSHPPSLSDISTASTLSGNVGSCDRMNDTPLRTISERKKFISKTSNNSDTSSSRTKVTPQETSKLYKPRRTMSINSCSPRSSDCSNTTQKTHLSSRNSNLGRLPSAQDALDKDMNTSSSRRTNFSRQVKVGTKHSTGVNLARRKVQLLRQKLQDEGVLR